MKRLLLSVACVYRSPDDRRTMGATSTVPIAALLTATARTAIARVTRTSAAQVHRIQVSCGSAGQAAGQEAVHPENTVVPGSVIPLQARSIACPQIQTAANESGMAVVVAQSHAGHNKRLRVSPSVVQSLVRLLTVRSSNFEFRALCLIRGTARGYKEHCSEKCCTARLRQTCPGAG